MEDNKFFRYVWRFNAIVIMASGLLALTSLMFVLSGEIFRTFRDRQNDSIVNIDRDLEIESELKIEDYREVKGTAYLKFPLTSQQSYQRNSYSSKSTSSTRNFLFVNSRTNQKQWLLANNDSLIISDRAIFNSAHQDKSTQAILYTSVTEDSNQDRRLTSSDLQTIGISLFDGTNYQEIVTGVDNFFGYKSIDDSQIVVIYQQQKIIYSQIVNLKDLNSLAAKPTIIYQPSN